MATAKRTLRSSARVFKTASVLEELDRDDTTDSESDDNSNQKNLKRPSQIENVTIVKSSSDENSEDDESLESEYEQLKSESEGLESETEGVESENEGVESKPGSGSESEKVGPRTERVGYEHEEVESEPEIWGSGSESEGVESEPEEVEYETKGVESETEGVESDMGSDSHVLVHNKATPTQTDDDPVDRYFSEQAAKSTDVTKNSHKSLPKMDRKTMNQILAKTPDPFQSSIKALYEMYRALHNYWLVQISNGFNILFYGYGSKQKVIEDFCKANLSKECYLIVNGFFPGLTLKQILNELTLHLLEHSGTFKNTVQQCNFICSKLCEDDGDVPNELFLIIHNIDGPSLRDEKAQIALSMLATCPKVHIIATIDHLNSPLLWNEIILSRYNWAWHDTTTFERYTIETSYENSVLVQQSGALAMSSLTHVLTSLPEKAQKIFEVLATHHLEHKEDPSYVGLPYAELYRTCREKFLANSDVTLRSQLIEFLDHKLIRCRKGRDGTETLSVLVKEDTLQQFIKNKK